MKYSFQTLFLAVWPVLQRVGSQARFLWAIRMAIISVCWVNFQTCLIFVCGYQWMYIVDQLIIDKVLFTFQQMFLHLFD